jgi:hypothetical protein
VLSAEIKTAGASRQQSAAAVVNGSKPDFGIFVASEYPAHIKNLTGAITSLASFAVNRIESRGAASRPG